MVMVVVVVVNVIVDDKLRVCEVAEDDWGKNDVCHVNALVS